MGSRIRFSQRKLLQSVRKARNVHGIRVTITGGTGFIGSRLALRGWQRGWQVRVLGQENTPAERENRQLLEACGVEVICGSVTERDSVVRAVQGAEVVYHLAAAQHEAKAPDAHFWHVNVHGTRTVLEASLQAGVRRFVHGSTIGVYGAALAGMLDETSPLNPDNIYGVTKREGEKLALSFQERLPVVVIRIAETYGPGDRRLLKLFRAMQRNLFFLIGSGRNVHHPVYIDDLLHALELAAEVDRACGEIFVIAGKEYLTTREMVARIAEVLGKPTPHVALPMFVFDAMAMFCESTLKPLGLNPIINKRRLDFFKKNFAFSLKKANDILGFYPEYNFKEGVEETVKWYKDSNDQL